jgi:hypothetical protein
MASDSNQPAAAAEEEETVQAPLSILMGVAATMSSVKPQASNETLLGAVVRACDPGLGSVYALVDGAQAFDLAFTARLMGNHLYTLFSGALAVDLAHVGPCLIALPQPEAFLEKWVAAIGTHPGIIFQSRAELPRLYAHLRRIFIVQDEDQQEYFFRFYDPRVLRVFLPTCTDAELEEFFGPVEQWIAEDEAGAGLTVYRRNAAGLTQTPILEG